MNFTGTCGRTQKLSETLHEAFCRLPRILTGRLCVVPEPTRTDKKTFYAFAAQCNLLSNCSYAQYSVSIGIDYSSHYCTLDWGGPPCST